MTTAAEQDVQDLTVQTLNLITNLRAVIDRIDTNVTLGASASVWPCRTLAQDLDDTARRLDAAQSRLARQEDK